MKDNVLKFDERATEYSSRTNLHPTTLKGDVETAYTIAASEQTDMCTKIYVPYIKYLLYSIKSMSDMIERSSDIDETDKVEIRVLINHVDEKLSEIPYMLRRLPDAQGFLMSSKETDDEVI